MSRHEIVDATRRAVGELIAVKVRALCALLVAPLAATLLAGCGGSNVGVAAKVGGQVISETQLSDYVTPSAKGIDLSGTGTLTPPKSFVLYILINNAVYRDLLRRTGGNPSTGRVSSLINTYVGNSTPQHAVTALGVHGYAPTFATKVLTYRALNQLLVQRARKGVKVGAALKKLRLPVEINPRFGVWNRKRLSVSSAPTKGLPNFLTLQSGSTGSSSLSG